MTIRGNKPNLKPIAGGLNGVPALPSSLPACMRDDWETVATDLRDRRLLTRSVLGTLETYIRSLWLARKAQDAVEELGVLVNGKANPAIAMLRDVQRNIASLAPELGITPSSRSRESLRKLEASPAAEEEDLGL